MLTTHNISRSAFTLLELLLVVAMIGAVASISLYSLNPAKRLGDAADSKRRIEMRETEKAIIQYLLSDRTFPPIPEGIENAVQICQHNLDPVDCVSTGTGFDLSVLVPDYVVGLPVDPNEMGQRTTGYGIYKGNSVTIKICSPLLEPACAIPKPI